MSYCDLIPPRASETVNFSRIKHQESEELSQEVSNWIACGGKMTIIPLGIAKNNKGEPTCFNEFDPTKPNEYEDRKEKGKKGALANKRLDPSPMGMFPARSGTAKKSDHGMNIRKNKSGYFVVIGASRMSEPNPDHEVVKSVRDRIRATLNMPPADY
jgi:hypothetical protein